MPIIGPSRRSRSSEVDLDGLTPLGAEISHGDRVANALALIPIVDRLKPRVMPVRPDVLTYDDNQIVEAYQGKDHNLGKPAAEQLRYFGAWSAAVLRVEGERTGSLLSLVRAINALELSGEHRSEVVALRSFIRQHYRCSLPDPVPSNWAWCERWANRFGQDRRTLPLYLRTMTKPPVGEGGRRSGSAQTEAETQQYLDYDDHGDPNEPGF